MKDLGSGQIDKRPSLNKITAHPICRCEPLLRIDWKIWCYHQHNSSCLEKYPGGEMPIEVLDHVGKFTEALHKVYTFVEAQQKGNKVKNFFRQGEMSTLLKDCQAGLQQSFDFFQIEGPRTLPDIAEMRKDAERRHHEVLDMIEKLSEATASERASMISGNHSWSSIRYSIHFDQMSSDYTQQIFFQSSNSISMLPSEPKIFHGRESELSDILHLFNTGIPRIAILGAGGMGKTSLAMVLLHHKEIIARYAQNRFFVACTAATTKLELVNLIGAHLGLEPAKDLTQAVLQHVSSNPPSLLILDELETLWEPITMRGAERPAKVLWTRPFLRTLQPLDQQAACLTFVDIADSGHNGLADVDLIQSKLPLENILACKAALKSTALAYSDEHKRLKVLMPIREYLQQHQLPGDHLVQKVFTYFEQMLKFYREYIGTQLNSKTVSQIQSHFTNIQNVLQWGLKQKQPILSKSHASMHPLTLLIGQAQDILPHLHDHRLKAYFIIEMLNQSISYPNSDFEALAFSALEHLQHFDDPDLKCKLYNIMAPCYQHFKADLVEAENMCKKLGKYSGAQMYAYEAQKLGRVSGDIYTEAQAVRTQAVCLHQLGDYKQSLSLCIMAQSLLGLCGMSGSETDLYIMSTQAEVHKCKSEYSEAWKLHTQILQIIADRNPYEHAVALLNMAEIEVLIDLYLREQDLPVAKALLQKSLKLAPENNEIKLFCLERLGNVNCWGPDESIPGWTTIFLVLSLKSQAKLQVCKALQFFGQMFLMQNDEDTAISLFTVALEGFTYMDVHCSRAECMLRLGDISKSHGDQLKAVELWTPTRALFERSSQAKQVRCVDERLAGIGSDVLEQHKENLAHLVELNVSCGNPCDIQDEEQVELADEPHRPVVV
ncbi:hypothetical protein B0H14DRAFT_3652247 [Mycena olivaceomarginata]|nr:hypothetical protein B0H14DRAFT_3652247 [Mycena olivaceomarginata]